jgi:putative LysE/RhtB family amino acid efflux pump
VLAFKYKSVLAPAYTLCHNHSRTSFQESHLLFDQLGVFHRGLLLGLMIAAPVGPVGLLCIRRSLQRGLVIGLFTGLGAAIADTIYGAVAAFGVTAILDFIKNYNAILRIIGGAFLLAVAAHTWSDHPRPSQSVDNGSPKPDSISALLKGYLNAAMSATLITIGNPATLFGTVAVVATFGDLESGTDAGELVMGIFAGSALWWVALSSGVTMIRDHFSDSRIIWALASGAQKIGVLTF